MRMVLSVLVVFLFAGFASAITQCDWDVLSDDFDDNSSGWAQTSIFGLCPADTWNLTIASGELRINQTYDLSLIHI